MRIQPWMSAVAGAAMLLAAQTPSSGQTPVPGGGAAYYPPISNGFSGAGPSGYYPPASAPGGSADPGPLYPPATPESFQPWPQISPYYSANVGVDQHFNSEGLWFRELFHRQRRYFGSVEAMAAVFRDTGNALIGSPYAAESSVTNTVQGAYWSPVTGGYGNSTTGTTTTTTTLSNGTLPSQPAQYLVSPYVYPYPSLSRTNGEVTAQPTNNYYPIYDSGILHRVPTTPGIQLRWGFENEDDTGMMITGWWAFNSQAEFLRGQESINGVPVTPTLTALLAGQNLSPTNGVIPLYNGEGIPGSPDFGAGSTAKYDVLYDIKYTTQAGGANISVYQEPVYRSNAAKLRPLWGLRYLNIGETFSFRGIDSGFNYELTDVTTGTGTGGTGGTGGNAGGNQQQLTNRPTGTIQQLYNQYTATLNNSVQSNIAGPEIGLRFDLGDSRKGFNVWGESIFGVNVNNERILMSGNNIGDPLTDVRFNGNTPPRMLSNDATFNSSKNTTHVSPLFQQSIFADFDFLDVVPVIKDMAIFDDATFRIGYTFLWVGVVSRPADSISWQGYPLFPQIASNHTNWWVNQFTFSIDWHF